jgi:methanogenic corrinoid protein MtbC1
MILMSVEETCEESGLGAPRKATEGERGTAVLCNIEGEYHEVGLRMFAELLREQGWETDFLGSNSYVDSLRERARRTGGFGLLCVSATMPSNIPSLIARLRMMKEEPLFAKTKIVVGGSAFRSYRARAALLSPPGIADVVAEDFLSALRYTASLKRER